MISVTISPIVNELSTYSYRLQRMQSFLEKTNKSTLLLLDEFGTGSDPELGGALAEVFLKNSTIKSFWSDHNALRQY